MRLIIGLGNSGKEYESNRHNIGFKVADYLNKEFGGDFEFDKKINAEISEAKINGKKALIVKPQTFMNNSGEAIKKLAKNYKIKPDNIIVIHDDLDILFGKVKMSFGRSSAGHKGVESIIRALKTEKFYRIRVGTLDNSLVKIRKIKDKRKRLSEMNKFVIGSFSQNEKTKLNRIIKEAAQKIISIL